jgi:hypothetical protein
MVAQIVFIGEKSMENSILPQENKKPNPLAGWYRQPKIYISLPSKGRFYPPGALDASATGDYPVYAMTAKDELMFKTPDALLNGQATVEVIKSCVPAIQDPWAMPSIDVDAVLIGVRIATYGENMDVAADCPHCNHENQYEVELTQWLSAFNAFEYNSDISIDPLVVHVRPFSYQEMTKNSLKTLEHQKIFTIINDEAISDEEKIEKFGKSFVKLTQLTVDVVASCISQIDTPDGSSSDPAQINEFINNASKEVFDKISEHVSNLKSKLEMPPMDVQCESCEGKFIMPLVLDQSNFFAVRS